ncbi:MAG: cytochrome c [Chloroflexi bacterium]|nr:cytochrome c [Chloroflexota bacterium]
MTRFTVALVVLIAVLSACTAVPQPPATPTVGQLAEAGSTVFANQCARCHGDSGQGGTGPAIIGANAFLSAHVTGQGLLDFVSQQMPFDAPGSLSQQEYLQVVSFLLVRNNFLSNGSSLDAGKLDGISLKK